MKHNFELTIETSQDLDREEIEEMGSNILEGLNFVLEEVGLTPNDGYTTKLSVNHELFSEPITKVIW